MDYQWIKEFLTSISLYDIVVFVVSCSAIIKQIFTKKFVKKDNLLTTAQIEAKVVKVGKFNDELISAKHKLDEAEEKYKIAKENWEQEKKQLLLEIESIKKAVKLSSCNSKELVKNGIAKEIVQILKVEEFKDMEEK